MFRDLAQRRKARQVKESEKGKRFFAFLASWRDETSAAIFKYLWIISGLLLPLIMTDPVIACGGVTATIADDPQFFGIKMENGPGGTTLHFDKSGNVYVAAKDIEISSALADAVAKRYLDNKYKRYEHLEFEAFTYDHGDLVYMYHAHVPNLAYSVHVGPLKSVADHAHVHVSALTGDVYGPGCGFGSGAVEMKYDSKDYPADLQSKRLPYLQFNTNFIAREEKPPKIDGRIEKEEWQGAGHEVIHIGTSKSEVTEYGWGGPGQAVAFKPEQYKVEIYSTIHDGVIYFGVRTDTTKWLALLLKDFEHHGMIGDFNDAKLLTSKGVEDYFLAGSPSQKEPRPRKLAGVHTWMAAASLVRDKESNLKPAGFRKAGKGMEYEFAFPYRNEDLGDSFWQLGRAYQIAILVGPGEEFQAINENTWMSDQIYIRLGSRSRDSIYQPSYLPGDDTMDHREHSHGGEHEQKGKTK